MSLEESILSGIHESIKKRDLQALSKGIEKLRSKSLLTDANKAKIEGWIEENFPISMASIGKSLLESEDDEKDEKEREEKIPPLHPKNICSSDTQKDLTGDKMSPMMEQVITFLLPKSKKSECITEYDISKIVEEKEDEVYLYDSSKNKLLVSVPVYRLPTSGTWVVGSRMYFRIFRAYQLESFGKHTISVEIHKIGSVWRQEHELFLAKPLHWNDFVAFIRDNTSFPITPSACACMFNPEEVDWSETAKNSLPVNECHWMIPTWNGIPVFLGKTCDLLNWAFQRLIIPYIRRGILTTLDQSSIKSLGSLQQFLQDDELYVKTDRAEKARVMDLSYKFVWTDPQMKIPGKKYIGEVSARLGKWPTGLEIDITLNSDVKGNPIEFIAGESSLLNIGQTSTLREGGFRLYWKIATTDKLPEIPESLLSIRKIEQVPGFMDRFIIEKDQLFLLQNTNRVRVRPIYMTLIYADGTGTGIWGWKLSQVVSKIREYVIGHGPPVRLQIGLDTSEFRAENHESAQVVGKNDKVILPLTDEIFVPGEDEIMFTYVVNLS
jgi:hypothetical protein